MTDTVIVESTAPKKVLSPWKRGGLVETLDDIEVPIDDDRSMGRIPSGTPTSEDDFEPTDPEERSFKKRYSDLRSYSSKKERELQSQIDALKKQVEEVSKTSAPASAYPASEEDFQAWASQHPDIYNIVRTAILKEVGDREKNLESRFAEIEEMKRTARKKEAEAELMQAHPDFRDIRRDPRFKEWVDDQPQSLVGPLFSEEYDVRAVSRLLDLFKRDVGIEKRAEARRAAAPTRTRTPGATPASDTGRDYLFSESQIDKMRPHELEAKWPEIQRAMAEGKFLYDLKGNRVHS
jgi:hypothetical protein